MNFGNDLHTHNGVGPSVLAAILMSTVKHVTVTHCIVTETVV